MTSRRADRRTAKRVLARLHPTVPGRVNFTAGEIEGGGMILDISAGGANVHEASHRLEPGTKVELFFLQPKTERRIRGEAEVVRKTKTGFAVRFLRLERELKTLVLAAVAKSKSEN